MEVWMVVLIIVCYLFVGIIIQRQLGLVTAINERGKLYRRPSRHRWHLAKRIAVAFGWGALLIVAPILLIWESMGAPLKGAIAWLLVGGAYEDRRAYGYYHNGRRSSLPGSKDDSAETGTAPDQIPRRQV